MSAYILHIETATQVCGTAISQNGKVLFRAARNEPNIHAQELTPLISEVLDLARLQFNQLSAISVSAGPGSYTGLRIGVSTAKGLCFALDIPLIAVSTLRAMADGMQAKAAGYDLLCPMIDARRMEVYTALYLGTETVLPGQPMIINETSFAGFLADQKILFFGNGAAKCRDVLSRYPNASFAGDFFCSAAHQASLAYASFITENFADVAYFEPQYLKEFQGGK